MTKTFLVSICVLLMVTTGILACVPVSAESTSTPDGKIVPLAASGYFPPPGYNSLISFAYWDCYAAPNGIDNGLYIQNINYNGNQMIFKTFQTGLGITVSGPYYYYPSLANQPCTQQSWIDSNGGWHHKNEFTITPGGMAGNGYIIYTAEICVTPGGALHFGNYMKWIKGSYGNNIVWMEAWWKIYYKIGGHLNTAWKNSNTQITTESETISEENWMTQYFKDANSGTHYIYDFNSAFSSTYHPASVLQGIENFYTLLGNANGQTITSPIGTESIDIANPSSGNLYYSWTEWYCVWY